MERGNLRSRKHAWGKLLNGYLPFLALRLPFQTKYPIEHFSLFYVLC